MTTETMDILFRVDRLIPGNNGYRQVVNITLTPAVVGYDQYSESITGIGLHFEGEDEDPVNELFDTLQDVIDNYYPTKSVAIINRLNFEHEDRDFVLGELVFVIPEVQAAIDLAVPDTLDDIDEGTVNKSFTATLKTKLDGIASGATANDTDSNLKARANHTGTQTASTISDFSTAADARITDQKGTNSGLCPLDSGGLVASAYLPSYVDDVIEAANFGALPGTGATGKIYVTTNDNKCFRWSGSVYIEVSPGPGSTDSVVEGSTNLYFTPARARAAQHAYQGTTERTGVFPVFKSATVGSGVAVFHFTNDGLSTGTALFPTGPITESVNCFVHDSAASYQMAGVWSNSNKTLTVTSNKLTTANILTGILGQSAANTAVVNVQVWGY